MVDDIKQELIDPNIKKFGLDRKEQERGTIADGEYHPAADAAMRWFKRYVNERPQEYLMARTSIEMAAGEGNKLADIALATIRRLQASAPVSDRYLLGLCWLLQDMRGSNSDFQLYKFQEARKNARKQ